MLNKGSGSDADLDDGSSQTEDIAKGDVQGSRALPPPMRCRCKELLESRDRGSFTETSNNNAAQSECTFTIPDGDSQTFVTLSLYRALSMENYRFLVNQKMAPGELSESEWALPVGKNSQIGSASRLEIAQRMRDNGFTILATQQFTETMIEKGLSAPTLRDPSFLFLIERNKDLACLR